MALTPKQIKEMSKKLKDDEADNKKLLAQLPAAGKLAEKLKSTAKDAKKELGTETE